MTFRQLLDRFRGLERGTRRSIIVLVLTAVLGGGAVGGGQVLLGDWQTRLQALQRELRGVEAETERLRDDLAFVKENTARYEAVIERGMFANRDRLAARRALEREVRAARVQGEIVVQPERRRAPLDRGLARDYAVVETPIQLSTGAMLDSDIYTLVREITTALPGYLVLQSARLERKPEVTAEDLTSIRNGLPVDLVLGRFVYVWRTADAADGEGEDSR